MGNIATTRTTIYDLAEKAGVSIATISRVINNQPNVNEHTRTSVLKLLEKTSYKPKIDRNKIPCLGVILEADNCDINHFNDYNVTILRGVSDYVLEHGLSMSVLPFSNRNLRRPEEIIRYLQGRGVDGAIAISHPGYDECYRALCENMFPLSVVGKGLGEEIPCRIQRSDAEGVELLLRHLVDLGYERIGFVGVASGQKGHAERLETFKRLAASMGRQDAERLIYMSLNYHSRHKVLGYETIMGVKSRLLNDLPDALFCLDDDVAVGTMKALHELGVKIPQDIAIVGYEDFEYSDYVSPSLTSVKWPLYEIGRFAAASVHFQLEGKKDIEKKIFPPELVVRESCGTKRKQQL